MYIPSAYLQAVRSSMELRLTGTSCRSHRWSPYLSWLLRCLSVVSFLWTGTQKGVALAFGTAIAITACGHLTPPAERNWRLLWHDSSQNYYVDTSTVHVVGDSVEAIAWDIRRVASRSLGHFPIPRVESTREDVRIRCSTRVISGVTITSTSSLRVTGGQSVSVFAGSANVGRHLALARFLCK